MTWSKPYRPGTYLAECERCGWTYYRTELAKETRTGYVVCSSCYDPIHPNEELRNTKAEKTVYIDVVTRTTSDSTSSDDDTDIVADMDGLAIVDPEGNIMYF